MGKIYTYLTFSKPSEGSYHESGSKFLAHALPVHNRFDLEKTLTEIKSQYPKARHHCYAYRILDRDEITEYASDAGEPSGSAGQPILGDLRRNELINVIVIVVRYFGGTKLGIPGLIHAYRECTANAIAANEIIVFTRTVQYSVDTPLALQPVFYSSCKQFGIEIEQTTYDDRFHARINIPLKHVTEKLNQLLTIIAGREGDFLLLCEWLDVRVEKMD